MGEPLTYDGWTATELESRLGLPGVRLESVVGSTQDVANALAAAGAPAGTLVIAEEQTAGRGRGGRAWCSQPGGGIWLTLLERGVHAPALGVLSLRLGLRAARVLDRFAPSPVRLKWPNDLFVGAGKLGGILVETRWSGSVVEWVSIGLGVNVRLPETIAGAAALAEGTDRVTVLGELVPALRAAAQARGPLGAGELRDWRARDLAEGRRSATPIRGIVRGIDASGALVVDGPHGRGLATAGSLVFEEEQT
ncbi:MAG: biotin--[acetyl-CoA-carboxylase] ligase [Gemmatimonadota bacterium]|nr:biotin--[acetyl-CoA-carboxylase] ligase [Gemmatimonadota bacterium]